MSNIALIVNNEPIWQSFVESQLAKSEFRVDRATSILSALTKVQQSHYDLVIVGSPLDTPASIQTLAQLIRTRPSQRVMIASSQFTAAEAILAFEAGAINYIEKDFDSDKLSDTITDTLARKPGTEMML